MRNEALPIKKKAPINIVDLDEEEDRDKEGANEFMKQYARLWRNIFAKYQDSGFKLHKEKDFDLKANAP